MSENGGRAELPKGWEWKLLGEVAETSSGGTPRRSCHEFYENGTHPWLKIGDLNDSIVETTEERITPLGLKESSAELLPAGTLLLAMYGSIGKLGILGMEAATNQAICAIRPNEDVVSRDFLFWFLLSQRPILLSAGYGGAQANISQRFLKAFPVPIPPAQEQGQIVQEIEARTAAMDAGDVGAAAAGDRLRGLRRSFLASLISGSWPRVPLMDALVQLRNGIFVSRPATDPPGIPILRISAVRPMEFDATDRRYAPADLNPDEKYFAQNGDLLFTRYSGNPNYVGACALVEGLREPVLHPDKLIRAVVDRSKAEPAFLAIACSVGKTHREIVERRKTTAGQVGIAGGQLKTVSVPLPPLDVQREVVAAVSKQRDSIAAVEEQLAAAETRSASLRRLVLSEAFAPRDAGENRRAAGVLTRDD